ncbi:MAG: hypothetical protein IT347_04615 [Candidatus Eisenbacteria bacterium]|nr:hypothetical protein [Candidatus Eisenbacteria bacterium]
MDAPHESPTEGNKPKAERKGFWRSTFDWRMSPAELAEQVSGYSSLGIGKSYRKLSAMLWLLTVAITALIGPWLMKMDWIAVISNTVIYSGLAIPCFRGHRWAFVLSMALWTIEKGYFLLESVASPGTSAVGGRLVTSVIWWAIYMGVFWKALTVERVRRRDRPSMAAID